MALASNQQWEYLLDMETWVRDTIDTHSMTTWLERLLKADPDRFTHWITKEKQDDFAFYLFKNIELHIREYDQDPGEVGDDFFSEDQTYYIRLRPYAPEHEIQQQARDLFLTDMLKRLSVFDFLQYRDFLLESSVLIPAEAEEELYRLRNGRLAEKGFLPFDEAIGVYQPLTAGDLATRKHKTPAYSQRSVESYPLPVDPAQTSEDANLFARTLARFNEPAMLQQLQAEFAGLCNQIVAADQKPIREKAALKQVVRKAGDYISIGLEKVASEASVHTPYNNETLLQTHLLSDIFRVGYGCALALKWTADKWRRASWFTHEGLPLSFWGEAWMGILGGLLLKKPLFYDNYASGTLYREFATLSDIQRSEAVLCDMIAFDDLFSLMGIEIETVRAYGFLSYQSLILTLWANHHLDLAQDGKIPIPLTVKQLKRFCGELFQPGEPPRKIGLALREIFLGWLAGRSGLATYDITERMASALEQLFKQLEGELGRIEAEDLDPRYIQLFLLR